MSSKVSGGISKCNVDVSSHFLQTLQKYGIKQSGLYSHLSYRSAYLSEIIHKEHDYAKQTPTNDERMFKPTFTAESEDIWHRALVSSDMPTDQTKILALIITLLQTLSVMKISFLPKKLKHC